MRPPVVCGEQPRGVLKVNDRKLDADRRYRSGESVQSLAAAFGIRPRTVRHWLAVVREAAKNAGP